MQLSADQRRLYASSQGVTPATLDAVPLPKEPGDRPNLYRANVPAQHLLGGDFQMTPDDRYLLFKSGTVLKTATNRDEDMRYHAAVGPYVAAAVSPEAKAAFFLTRDGSLSVYSYPDFKPLATHRLGIVATQAVCATKDGRLYVAGVDPRTVGDRPRAKGVGDVFVFELKDVLGTGISATKR